MKRLSLAYTEFGVWVRPPSWILLHTSTDKQAVADFAYQEAPSYCGAISDSSIYSTAKLCPLSFPGQAHGDNEPTNHRQVPRFRDVSRSSSLSVCYDRVNGQPSSICGLVPGIGVSQHHRSLHLMTTLGAKYGNIIFLHRTLFRLGNRSTTAYLGSEATSLRPVERITSWSPSAWHCSGAREGSKRRRYLGRLQSHRLRDSSDIVVKINLAIIVCKAADLRYSIKAIEKEM